ncbi:MAG: response regulator [Candidatus Sericytochromatia bacterium]
MSIRIVIGEDSGVIQKLLKAVLEKEKDFEIVGTATDGEDTYNKIVSLKPDVVLIDHRMPKTFGMEIVKRVMSTEPVSIIMITSAEPFDQIKAEALKYGAMSVVEKPKQLDFSSISRKLITDIRTFSKMKPAKKTF